jgi:uncharacterized protein (TIGR02246 family)
MRRIVVLAATVLLMGLHLSTSSFAASMEDQIKAAYDAFNTAFNKGDAKAVAGFYTDDAILLGPGPDHAVFKGPAEIEKFFAGLFSAGVTNHNLDLIKAIGNDNLVIGADKWTAKSKDSPIGGNAVHVFEKQSDGSLKLKLHTFN